MAKILVEQHEPTSSVATYSHATYLLGIGFLQSERPLTADVEEFVIKGPAGLSNTLLMGKYGQKLLQSYVGVKR